MSMNEKITGYHYLSRDETDLINEIKAQEDRMVKDDPDAERWLPLARTHLETGLMFLVKAVARPTNGLGRR
jgi:hypothetical protein